MGNMPEENPRGMPPRRPAGNREERAGRPGRSGKKPSLAGMQVILVQSISCVAIVLLVLVIKLIGGDAFSQLRRQFNESIMSNSVVAALAALFETPNAEGASSVDDVSAVDPAGSAADSSAGSMPPASSQAPAQSGDSSSAPSSGASQTEGTTASRGETSGSGSSSPEAASSSVTASGTAAQTVRYAPEGSSFTTVRANQLARAPLPTGKLTSDYGYRKNPTKEGIGFHKGVDIGAPEGTAIHAMYFGVVTAVGEEAGYGKYIKLYHGNGIEILYAHCSEILAQKDAVIRAGETVAKVGATGDVTGPHLHVELRVDGITYNPAGMIPERLYA